MSQLGLLQRCSKNLSLTNQIITSSLKKRNGKVSFYVPACNYKNTFQSNFATEKIKEIDGVPPKCELIYRTGMYRYIQGSHAFATISTAITIPLLIYSKYTEQLAYSFPNDSLLGDASDLYFFGAGFFIFNVALIITSLKFCLRIYFHEERKMYIAVMPHLWMPMQTSNIECEIGGIKPVKAVNKLVPWNSAKYTMGGRNVLLLENSFRTSADFEKMVDSKISSENL